MIQRLNLSTMATLGTDESGHCREVAVVERFKQKSGFYLGCLRGRSFLPPPQKKKIVLITVYKKLYRKISSGHDDEVSANTVTFRKIESQNVLDCISAHIYLKKFQGGHAPPDPPGKLIAFGHSGLLRQTINPR